MGPDAATSPRSLGASLGIFPHHLDFWWELALLIVIMLLGHWIEMRSIAATSSALDALAALLPDEAERVVSTGSTGTPEIEVVSPSDLVIGDVVIVRPGGRVPGTLGQHDAPFGRGRRHPDPDERQPRGIEHRPPHRHRPLREDERP